MGCFFFRGLNPRSAPYSPPPPPVLQPSVHISSPKTATSCEQYARNTASNEGEIQQTTEIRLYNCSVVFHNDPSEVWWQI